MKKFLKIVYPIIVGVIVVVVILVTGNLNKKENKPDDKIDFTYATGSMISKEGMTEEEMKMHDAKLIQYALYNIKEVLQGDLWSGTKKTII